MLVDRYGGVVPRTMAELTALPGVARKTANVVMGNAYGIVEGVVVDTHVGRLARRLGLTTSDDPVRVEQDLMALVPQKDWLPLSHMLIYHGRAVCQARRPLCESCTLVALCPTGQANLARYRRWWQRQRRRENHAPQRTDCIGYFFLVAC